MLVDVGVGLQDSDKMLIDMLSEFNKVFLLVATKADKVSGHTLSDDFSQIVSFIRGAGSTCIPIVHLVSAQSSLASSSTGYGIRELKANLLFHLK